MKKDLLHVLGQEREHYTDPLIEFLLALYNDMDFEKAKQMCTEMSHVFEVDYFLEDKASSIRFVFKMLRQRAVTCF